MRKESKKEWQEHFLHCAFLVFFYSWYNILLCKLWSTDFLSFQTPKFQVRRVVKPEGFKGVRSYIFMVNEEATLRSWRGVPRSTDHCGQVNVSTIMRPLIPLMRTITPCMVVMEFRGSNSFAPFIMGSLVVTTSRSVTPTKGHCSASNKRRLCTSKRAMIPRACSGQKSAIRHYICFLSATMYQTTSL